MRATLFVSKDHLYNSLFWDDHQAASISHLTLNGSIRGDYLEALRELYHDQAVSLRMSTPVCDAVSNVSHSIETFSNLWQKSVRSLPVDMKSTRKYQLTVIGHSRCGLSSRDQRPCRLRRLSGAFPSCYHLRCWSSLLTSCDSAQLGSRRCMDSSCLGTSQVVLQILVFPQFDTDIWAGSSFSFNSGQL